MLWASWSADPALPWCLKRVLPDSTRDFPEHPGGFLHASSTIGLISASVSKVIIPPDVLYPPTASGISGLILPLAKAVLFNFLNELAEQKKVKFLLWQLSGALQPISNYKESHFTIIDPMV